MTEAERIRGQQRRLWRCDDGPKELATTMEASEEEDEPEVLKNITEALVEEAEEATRPSERLRRQRRRCVYGIRVLTTKTVASAEGVAPEYLVTTAKASSGDEE